MKKKLVIWTLAILALINCTKEKPLQFKDFAAIRAHLRVHLEIFAITESLSHQIDYNK